MHLEVFGLPDDTAEVAHEHQLVVDQTVERRDVAGEHRRAELVFGDDDRIICHRL